MYISHKLLRWLAPLSAAGLLAANIALLGRPIWDTVLALQCCFYMLALFGVFLPRAKNSLLCKVPLYYTVQHVGGLAGIFRWLFGKAHRKWKSPERSLVNARGLNDVSK